MYELILLSQLIQRRPIYFIDVNHAGIIVIQFIFAMENKDIELLRKLTKKIQQVEKGGPTEVVEPNNTKKEEEEHLDSDYPDAYNQAIGGFILHCLFKGAVFMMFLFRGIFSTVVNGLVLNEMIAVFAVIDFWVTKNVSGKRLLGVRWFFDTDEHGTEKFFFECRANDKYISFMWTKLFWVIQIVYTFMPFVTIIGGFIQAFYVLVNLEMIITSVGIMVAGGSNLFFFFQANSAAQLKQKELKRKLKPQDLDNMKFATVYCYA